MITELEVLAIATARLEAMQIAYMLTGSYALALYTMNAGWHTSGACTVMSFRKRHITRTRPMDLRTTDLNRESPESH
jgi:hypothetical protein